MKKGFTLVELLAVVVILALILAIAVPAITNITTTAKKNMFENSSKMIIKSMKNDYDGKMASTGSFTDTFILYDNGVKTVYPSGNNLDFTISATDGGIVRHSDGTVTFALYDGSNCLVKTRTSNDINVTVTDKATCVSNIIYKQASAPFSNLITNGEFITDLSGWSGDATNISFGNKILVGTGNSSASTVNVFYTPNIISRAVNKKSYLSAQVRVTNSVCSSISIRFFPTDGSTIEVANINNPISNQFYKLSGIYTETVTSSAYIKPYIRSSYVDVATASGKVLEIDDVISIDLTQIYGAGNEPTIMQMDHNLNKVWIDTTTANTPKKFTAGGWVSY